MTVQSSHSAAEGAAAGDHARGPVRVRTTEHELILFPEAAPLFDELLRLIDIAKDRVCLETYIYRSDRMGKDFARHLLAAASRGVEVRLIYDPLGSKKEDPRFFESLAAGGVKVRPYRPWKLARWRWSYWPRDHGRVVLIDDFACTGGINWGNEWWPVSRGGDGWHDVSVGVRGPVVGDFERTFLRRWHEASQLDPVADWATTDPNSEVELLADSPASVSLILDRFVTQIESSEKRVWIENSYCVPPTVLLRALDRAASRGVDVQLLMPAKTDIPFVRAVGRGEYERWLDMGVSVLEYQPSVMHAKFAIVDDDWATVGTFNAMTPGVWWANETNLVIHNRGFVEELATLFLADVGKSSYVTTDWLRSRPRRHQLAESLLAKTYRGVELLSAAARPFIRRAFDAEI